MHISPTRLTGGALIVIYVFLCLLFACMQAHDLVFAEESHLPAAIVLCLASFLGLLIWHRRCRGTHPEIALVARIILLVSAIAWPLILLSLPAIT